MKGWKGTFHAIGKHKKAGIAVSILEKETLRQRGLPEIKRDISKQYKS